MDRKKNIMIGRLYLYIALPLFYKRCHTFRFSLSHRRCYISLFEKNSLSYEYKNYIFTLHLTHKTKPPKILCRPTSVTSFVERREYYFTNSALKLVVNQKLTEWVADMNWNLFNNWKSKNGKNVKNYSITWK